MLVEIKKVASDSTMTAAMMTTFINAAKQRPDKVKEVLKGKLG